MIESRNECDTVVRGGSERHCRSTRVSQANGVQARSASLPIEPPLAMGFVKKALRKKPLL